MRFTLSSTALSGKLTALSRVISSKNSLPILSDFVFEVEGTTLRLTASDRENTMRTSMEVGESDGNGSFAIGSHDLLEGLRGFSEQPITFEVDNESGLARIVYQNGQFSLPIDSVEEYPQPQELSESATVVTLPSELLADCVGRSLFATAQDELRPVMNGIFFDLTPDCLAIVASDGHKLVRNRVHTVKSEAPTSFVLPKKPATLLKALLSKDGGEVVVRFDERNAEIDMGDAVLTCRLIEGHYPNYNSVIPTNNPSQLTVDRMAMLSALRRVQPFANNSSNLVRLRMEGGTLQLDAEDYDFSKTATERLACDYSGIPMSIGFKGSSLIDILGSLDSQEITMMLADPSRAGLVVPTEQPEGQDVLMLLMPMLVNE